MTIPYVSTLFAQSDRSRSLSPDSPTNSMSSLRPELGFVLCRNSEGQATAVYGDDEWDFNPYRLSAKKINIIKFKSIFSTTEDDQALLIEEVKYALFCLIYYIGTGRVGKLSAVTISGYFHRLGSAARFCYEQKHKPLVGVLSLKELLTTPVYLAAFVTSMNGNDTFIRRFPPLMRSLVAVGGERLGYKVLSVSDLDFGIPKGEKQTPVIPTRIYLEIINNSSDILDRLLSKADSLSAFISDFVDRYYGLSDLVQQSRGIRKRHRRATFEQAVNNHGLTELLVDDFKCSCRRSFSLAISSIQFLLKMVIHLYTGMRDQEVMRLKYECLAEEVVVACTTDSNGKLRDPSKMVTLLSTTTKFEGYKKEESWLATAEVIKAVKLAQAIQNGLAKFSPSVTASEFNLFSSPSILISPHAGGLSELSRKNVRTSWLDRTKIQPDDLKELVQTDTSRDFYSETKYSVGKPWPLASHQLRRSLAFYASNSGFVSLPSLKSQYKHMSLEMARYYRNGFENLKTIFGYYDPIKKDFVLPKSHIALEFQMGMPISIANEILANLITQDTPLFGGTGSYMEKQKSRIKSGQLHIEDLRADTLARVKAGEISYRPTLLGGCTKVGRCDSLLLGEYTACLSCDGAVIKSEKINEAIKVAVAELEYYSEGTGEYQVIRGDVEKLVNFRSRLIGVVEALL
ncbi:integrase [Pseudomonas weihenstephanensis]|nr:integrase [Pseudomonas weihenstephanensis]